LNRQGAKDAKVFIVRRSYSLFRLLNPLLRKMVGIEFEPPKTTGIYFFL